MNRLLVVLVLTIAVVIATWLSLTADGGSSSEVPAAGTPVGPATNGASTPSAGGGSGPALPRQGSSPTLDLPAAPDESGRWSSVRYDERGVAVGGIEPDPDGTVPLNIDNIIASADKAIQVSLDGRDTFTVPVPGDPEWEDYLEFRRTHRTGYDNSPGFVIAYDPEWRSAERGYRERPQPPFLQLHGGRESLRALLEAVVQEFNYRDEQAMIDLAIRKEEFEEVCWPSFPQSRPFLRIPWQEAWGFHYANLLGGIKEGVRDAGEMDELAVESIGYSEVRDFGHFQIFDGVTVTCVDSRTGKRVTFDFIDSVIERDGMYKVFLYKD